MTSDMGKLAVFYLPSQIFSDCPFVFVESGHCVLLISEVQDILSYHFCFQCASLCISFLYQLLDVTALTNLIPAKHKSKFKLLSNFNYKLPNGENK